MREIILDSLQVNKQPHSPNTKASSKKNPQIHKFNERTPFIKNSSPWNKVKKNRATSNFKKESLL